MQRSVRIVCAPVLSGLDAAVQLPAYPAGQHPGLAAMPPGALSPHPLSRHPLPPLFLPGIRPALDCAFGTEDTAHFPDALAALVARLHAGPLGPVPAEAAATA